MTTNYQLAAAVTTLAVIAAGGFRTTVPDEAIYTSTTFAIPFEVTAPDWVGAGTAPFAELPHFVTWATSTEPDRAVRFLAPTAVIQPPNATEIAMPDDYVAYLHSLADYGASFDDVVETTVDGRPATILTATTANEIDGALGCEERPTGECHGLRPDLTLHIAVIDTDHGPLLVWERDPVAAAPVDYSSFDEMLASLHFSEGVVPATEPIVETIAPTASDPRLPEGLYHTAELTLDQLVATGVAAGFDEADLEAGMHNDGMESTATFGVQLADGRWTLLISYDGGPFNSGWQGTYEIVDDDTVTATQIEPECTITYTYAFDGAQLTLDMVDDPCFPGEQGEQMAQTVIYESAPFTLVAPATEPAAETTAPTASERRLPEGEYLTDQLTADQLIETGVANGLTEADVEGFINSDSIGSTATYELRLQNGLWNVLSSYSSGPYNNIFDGTYEVVDDDTVTVTGIGDSIGCTTTFSYAFDGAQLTLDIVEPCVLVAETVIYESAPFRLLD